jgi:hypothetical protein
MIDGEVGRMKCPAAVIPILISFITLMSCAVPSPADAQVSRRVHREDAQDFNVDRSRIRYIHDAGDGYAEIPSLALSPTYAYVAFDARTNGATRLHLCRADRTGRENIEEILITPDHQMTFGSSMTLDKNDSIWLAWTSHTAGQWLIKACRVSDMQPSPEVAVSGSEGLNSQVQVEAHQGVIWFVWINWEDDVYRVMANAFDGEIGQPRIIYEGGNPIGRPDLAIVSADRVVFVWDEYIDGRFGVRMRDLAGGRLEPVKDISGDTPGNSWDPCICAAGTKVLTGWQRVPWGAVTCRPAARSPAGILYEEGLAGPKDNETWRVDCFSGPDGNTWLLWLDRIGHRATLAFTRRIGPDGVSDLARIRLEGESRTFMNYLECACDHNLVLAWTSWGSVGLCEVEPPVIGDGELAATEEDSAEVESPGIKLRVKPAYTTFYHGDSLHTYFGDYHNHTSFSDGRTFPDMVMLFGRDTRKLDFICVTDHDGSLMPSELAWNDAVADNLTREGEFACLHGLEISKNWAKNDFGHWNMIFPGPVTIFRYEDGMTPTDLYEVAKQYEAVLIPHHIAASFAPHSWAYHDPDAEQAVEMCSIHGVFETGTGLEDAYDKVQGRFVDDGLAKGYRFGFVGASDYHNPFTGLKSEVGLTGVYASTLTPAAVIEAIKHHRTFATTGSMIVVDFRCNGRFMGEEMDTSGEIAFSGYAEAAEPISSLEIVSARRTVFRTEPDDTPASFTWTTSAPDSEAYYYLKVTTVAGDLAWSSPIWITPSQ